MTEKTKPYMAFLCRMDAAGKLDSYEPIYLAADSDDCGQGFRLNAATRSDRRRPPVPTKADGVSLPT
jgi:hypothetical protein